jgi:serine/threonine protein kinase
MNAARWAHADRLFDAALDRRPDERTAFLREACAGDEELLRAVESLLEHERDAGAFLETPAIDLMAQQRDAGPAVPLIGRDLAGYRVIELVGRGGMGEVYRARDTKLGRDVALKVLPPALTGDADRFARLGREARILAALNHPHIASIYGLEESDSGPALILEFVDGPTLADRLTAGALPVTEALAIARGIAEALDAAHEKGIVHRDLKPANIKVRADGSVKVLDFGLAKALDSDGAERTSLQEAEGTREGIIFGTAAYMAPEQARGKRVDKRADIWAFGAVFYEMVTGRRAFGGDDAASIIAAVIQSEPRWDGVPAQARRLIESCLEKDPRKRLRDIGDAWKLLSEAREPTAAPSPVRNGGWIAAAALAIVTAAALWAPWRSSESATARPLVRLDLDLGHDISLQPLIPPPTFSSLVVSPDGRRLVFDGSLAGGSSRLLVRHMDDATIRELPGTQGARNPFVSPDGQWVVFHIGRKISKVPLEGGAVVPLADLETMTGGSWDDDGNLIVGTGIPSAAGLVRIAPDGGPPSPLVQLGKGEMFLTFPQFLSGRNAVLVSTIHAPPILETSTIDVVSLADGSRKTLVRGAVSPKYLSSGHVVYANRSGVFALPVDLHTVEPRGQPVRVLSDALFHPVTGGAHMDVSRGGTFVYRKNPGVGGPAPMFVRWIDATGNQVPLLDEPGLYVDRPSLSPDGLSVALTVRDGADQDIYVFSTQRGSRTRLTHGGAAFTSPVWTSDGRHIVFGSSGEGMLWTRADGATRPQPLVVEHTSFLLPAFFMPNGRRLLVNRVAGPPPPLWFVDVAEDGGSLKAGPLAPWLASRSIEAGATYSPDGRWVAYHSNESGAWEVYVRPFATAATRNQGPVQVSNRGNAGAHPSNVGFGGVWSRNGRELFYLNRYQDGTAQVMVVRYTVKGESFVADKPRAWTARLAGLGEFDVAPDGKRLAVTLPVTPREAPTPDRTVVLLQNFLDELRRRAPADR